MKAATGNALLMNIIIVFLVVVLGVLVTSITYTKAFRIKNRIVEIIENYEGDFDNHEDDISNDINNSLRNVGYRLNNGRQCPTVSKLKQMKLGKASTNNTNNMCLINSLSTDYQICVYAVGVDPNNNCKPLRTPGSRGVYYIVLSYMYLDLPVINNVVNIPVYGETKVFYEE